jgi:KilA-N domain
MGVQLYSLVIENQKNASRLRYKALKQVSIKLKDGDFFVSDWLRNRNTIEFLSIWEEVHNPNFNCGESAIIKSQAWLHNYKISVKERHEKTHAIGIVSTAGRYGWTFAHKDIAFEFGMRISPKFKIYLIKEFQRLKEQEINSMNRSVKRFLTKINYKIHTDAIKDHLIPSNLTSTQINFVYADEADLLNVALFRQTAAVLLLFSNAIFYIMISRFNNLFVMFSTLPLNTKATVAILETIWLSDQARAIVKLSFRTRTILTQETIVTVQFRLDQETITESEKSLIESVHEEILSKLQKYYPDETFAVVIQVSMCCGSDCLWCRKFFG